MIDLDGPPAVRPGQRWFFVGPGGVSELRRPRLGDMERTAYWVRVGDERWEFIRGWAWPE